MIFICVRHLLTCLLISNVFKQEVFIFVLSAPSSRVHNVRLLGKTASSASFEWDSVECSLRHGLPLGYNFEITSSAYGHTLNANTTETRVRVQELVPFADYAYRVRFMNQAGYGYYSEPVQFQTLQGSEYHVSFFFDQLIFDCLALSSFLTNF